MSDKDLHAGRKDRRRQLQATPPRSPLGFGCGETTPTIGSADDRMEEKHAQT